MRKVSALICHHQVVNGRSLYVSQEAAINVFSTIKRYINDQTIRKLVLPKAKSLFTKSTNVRVSVPVTLTSHHLVYSLVHRAMKLFTYCLITLLQCH